MKWIVIEEDPKPDQYIAVLPATYKQPKSRDYSLHDSIAEALERARQLREKYRLHSIRLFQQGSHSVSFRD